MKKVVLFSILIFILLLTGYIYWFFYNVYADGYREGALIKFSRKGNIFKTNEGEMQQSVKGTLVPKMFYFSVIDDSLKKVLDHCAGREINVHYVQYRKSLPWRGENYNDRNENYGQYIVDRIEKIYEK